MRNQTAMPTLLCFVGAIFVSACNIQTGTAHSDDNSAAMVPSKNGETVRFTGSSVELVSTSDGRHTMVSGYVGEHGPYNFIIDTGSTPNAIDEGLAEMLGLEVADQQEVMSGGTVPMQVDLVEVPEVRLGGLSIHGASYISMPMAEMSGGQFHGMLGMDLFTDLTVSYDAANARITVSTDHLDPDDPGVMALDMENGGFIINADVAGQIIPMHVDTGSPNGFTFPASMMETIPVVGEVQQGPDARLAGGVRTIHEGTLDGNVVLGTNIYPNPVIRFMDRAVVGNLGGAVLNQYILSIDQENGLLGLQRPDASSDQHQVVVVEPSAGPRRIGVRFRGRPTDEEFIATDVLAGSLGESAGLMAGDVLKALNGQPIEDYTMQSLGVLFRGSDPLRFEVLRNGEIRTLEIG